MSILQSIDPSVILQYQQISLENSAKSKFMNLSIEDKAALHDLQVNQIQTDQDAQLVGASTYPVSTWSVTEMANIAHLALNGNTDYIKQQFQTLYSQYMDSLSS